MISSIMSMSMSEFEKLMATIEALTNKVEEIRQQVEMLADGIKVKLPLKKEDYPQRVSFALDPSSELWNKKCSECGKGGEIIYYNNTNSTKVELLCRWHYSTNKNFNTVVEYTNIDQVHPPEWMIEMLK